LIFGIISIFLGWVPGLGWMFVFLSIGLGIYALKQIKQKKLKGKGLAIAGLVLGSIGLIIAIAIIIVSLQNFFGGQAAQTDENGNVTFTIRGVATTFQVTTSYGAPIAYMTVSLAMNDAEESGVLMLIDSSKSMPMTVYAIQGPKSTKSNSITGMTTASEAAPLVKLLVPDGPATSVGKVVLEWLPEKAKQVGDVIEYLDLVVVAAKAAQAAGLPLGEYAEYIPGAAIETITTEEASEAFWKDVKEKAKSRVFFFLEPDFLATAGGNAPTPVGVVIDTLGFGFDANALFSCGLPNERVTRLEIGSAQFYGCRHLETREQVAGLVKAAVDGVDERGIPLSTGSLELFSKTNIGAGVSIPLEKGEGSSPVPIGDYYTRVDADGFRSQSSEVAVVEGDNTVTATLEPISTGGVPTQVPAEIPVEEGATQPPISVQETWSGTATGDLTPGGDCGLGTFTHSMNFVFTTDESLVAALEGGSYVFAKGDFSINTDVTTFPEQSHICSMYGEFFHNVPVTVQVGGNSIDVLAVSSDEDLLPGFYTLFREDTGDKLFDVENTDFGFTFKVTSVSDTVVTGVWDERDSGQGSFTLKRTG